MMYGFTPTNFMLLPTMSCQGRCVYCFGPNKGPVMSEKTADAAIDFIARIVPPEEKVRITFHGGEPLLAPVKWYAHVLPLLRERFGRRLRLSMQTNLLEVPDELLALLREYNICIGTSVDGYQEMCDAQRGSGYYEKNLASRKRLEKAGLSAGCICTFTPHFVSGEAVKKVFHSFDAPFSVHGAVPSLGRAPTAHDVNVDEMKTILLESYEVYKDNIAENRVSTIDSMVRGSFDGKGGVCTFYDCLGVFAAIAADGGVYSCQRFCGHEEYCLGNVNDGLTETNILQSKTYLDLRKLQDGTKEACDGCTHYDYCMGGCLYNRLAAKTEKDPYCEAYRAVFDKIAYDMALEMGGLMTGRLRPDEARVLAMAGDQPHPFDKRMNRLRILRAAEAAKPNGGGLPQLRERMLEFPERYRNKLYVHITFSCPLRCSHCYAEGGERVMPDLPVDTVLSAAKEAQRLGFASVVITGGEPLAHPEWDTMTSGLKTFERKGMRLILRTSFGFDIPAERLQTLCAVFPEIVVSIDGGRAYHDARRGAGSYDKTVNNLRRAKELGYIEQFSVCATLPKAEREGTEGEAVSELCKELGINNVRFRPILPLGRGADAKNEEAFHCLDADTDEPFSPRTSCGLGQNLYVEPDGSCYPCYAWCGEGTYLGNITDGLASVVESERFRELSCHDVDSNERCRSCEVRYLCGGMCKAWCKDKVNIDSGDFDCTARKATMLSLLHSATNNKEE